MLIGGRKSRLNTFDDLKIYLTTVERFDITLNTPPSTAIAATQLFGSHFDHWEWAKKEEKNAAAAFVDLSADFRLSGGRTASKYSLQFYNLMPSCDS